MAQKGIPQILLQGGLATHLIDTNSIKELRQLKHPIFPDNEEVTGPENQHWLRMQDVVATEEQLTRQSYLVRLFVTIPSYLQIELSRQPTFLKFQGFSVRRQPQGYEVSILLQYGGVSFDREMKKRKNRENYIVTEEELWECLLCIVNSLSFLKNLGIQRHGHLMFYSVRKIRNTVKLLYNPQMHTCYELAKHQAIEYYKLFLSPQELSALKNQKQHFSFESDIFSLGMMILNMATIIDLDNVCYIRRGIKESSFDYDNINRKTAYVANYYSKELLQLLTEMLKEDPAERPELSQLLDRIRKVMKENSYRRDRCMEQLLQHHQSAGISSLKYEFSADEETIKKEIEKMKKSKSKSKKKEEGFRIDFRGTFGEKPESPKKPLIVHAKTTVEIRTDEEEKEQQVPKMYQQKKASKKIESMVLKKKNQADKKEAEGSKAEENSKVQQGKQKIPAQKHETTQKHQLENGKEVAKEKTSKEMTDGTEKLQKKQYTQQKTDSHVQQPIKIEQMADTDIHKTPNGQSPEPPRTAQPKQLSEPKYPPPPPSPIKQPISQSTQQDAPRFASVPEATIDYALPKQVKSPTNLTDSPIKYQPSQPSDSYFQFPIKSPRSSSPSSSPQKIKPVEELVKQFENPGVYINGNVYYGTIMNGRRNGKGLQIFPSGQYYYGEFEDDLFHGQGLYFWSPKEYFKGTFRKGSKSQGKMVVAGRLYIGQFKDNKRHGKGKAIYGREMYEGEWKHGRKDGQGTMIYADGEIFHGRWQLGQKNGPGSLETKVFTINGEWLKDQLHGHCQIIYKNGDIYRGQYVDSQRTGQGEYYFSKGSRFKGLFQDDKMVQGTIYYSDGTIYEGGVSADAKRHGRGRYMYGHGETYEGEWSRNQKHGYGRISTQDYIYEGQWQQGLKHGQGILVDNRTGLTSRVAFHHDNLKT